ncbi:uncharacterized protein VTP21DRAFT_9829 [Calcarisporiella thermophila]|uniref:uncharacterized protein n=1 Tax=Calcarisporiella thermophila TaxID=911321 RepID=UPI003743C685
MNLRLIKCTAESTLAPSPARLASGCPLLQMIGPSGYVVIIRLCPCGSFWADVTRSEACMVALNHGFRGAKSQPAPGAELCPLIRDGNHKHPHTAFGEAGPPAIGCKCVEGLAVECGSLAGRESQVWNRGEFGPQRLLFQRVEDVSVHTPAPAHSRSNHTLSMSRILSGYGAGTLGTLGFFK